MEMTSETMKSSYSADTAMASENLMESFLDSMTPGSRSAREAWLARESMLSLMRLARSEQMLEIRRSVDKLVPERLRVEPVKRPKGKRGARKQPGQTQLAFGRDA